MSKIRRILGLKKKTSNPRQITEMYEAQRKVEKTIESSISYEHEWAAERMLENFCNTYRIWYYNLDFLWSSLRTKWVQYDSPKFKVSWEENLEVVKSIIKDRNSNGTNS